MTDDSIPIRSPFRPLQQSIHRSNKDRLKDSPMDFSYDSPSHHDNAYAGSSSSWLNAASDEGEKKRSREDMNASSEVFAFGSKDATTTADSSSGAFLFHQPCTPTVAGPDVEMLHEELTPSKAGEATNGMDRDLYKENHSTRPLSSSGALTRVSRSRNTASKSRSNGPSDVRKQQPHRYSSKSQRRKGKKYSEDDEGEEWENEEAEQRSTGRKRYGDTLTSIQYVFGGGGRDETANSRRHHRLSWLDPEWCLGMAQVIFNSALLLGLIWLFYGVVQTLQRDVADKVREYELGEL